MQSSYSFAFKAEILADPVIGWRPRYVCVSGSVARSSLTGGKRFQGLQGSWRCVPTALNASRDPAPGGEHWRGEADKHSHGLGQSPVGSRMDSQTPTVGALNLNLHG